MRLITRKQIWRAFPELDPYPDDRCRLFVRAANRGIRVNLARIASIILVFTLSLVLGTLILVYLSEYANRSTYLAVQIISIPIILASICAPPVLAYLTRDYLLRRRVRYVLRARGSCSACSYGLVGMPVTPASTVVCPECGFESNVDPALGELTTTEGRAVFSPQPHTPPRWLRWLTPSRRARLKKWTIRAAIALPLLLIALAGSYEGFIRWQARRARALAPTIAAWQALADAKFPATPPGETSAWDDLAAAIARIDAIEAAKSNPPRQTPDGKALLIDYTDLQLRPQLNESESQHTLRRLQRDYSVEVLDAIRAAGALTALDHAAANPNVRPTILATSAGFSTDLGVANADGRRLRSLARLIAGRMDLAVERDDPREFVDAARTGLALARFSAAPPLIIGKFVSAAIGSLVWSRVSERLMSPPPTHWLAPLQDLMDTHPVSPGFDYSFAGEKLAFHETLATTFGDPNTVRWGRFSPSLNLSGSGKFPKRLGTLDQNLREGDLAYDRLAALATGDPWLIPARAIPPYTTCLLNEYGPQASYIGAVNVTSLYPLTARTMLALERHRAAQGQYPDSLNALVPTFLPALPIDPFSGKPLGYKHRLPNPNESRPVGREEMTLTPTDSYILYTTAADHTDNDGVEPSGSVYSPSQTPAGKDYILNRIR